LGNIVFFGRRGLGEREKVWGKIEENGGGGGGR